MLSFPGHFDTADSDFMRAVYNNYKALMFKTAYGYLNDIPPAEDAVQDAVLRLAKNINALRRLDRCALSVYVVYTVRSASLDIIRQDVLRQKHGDWPCDITEIAPSAEDAFFRHQPNEALAEALKKLTQEEQTLIGEKYYLELSNAELAQLYKTTQPNMRTKLSRLRGKIRKHMTEGATHDE